MASQPAGQLAGWQLASQRGRGMSVLCLRGGGQRNAINQGHGWISSDSSVISPLASHQHSRGTFCFAMSCSNGDSNSIQTGCLEARVTSSPQPTKAQEQDARVEPSDAKQEIRHASRRSERRGALPPGGSGKARAAESGLSGWAPELGLSALDVAVRQHLLRPQAPPLAYPAPPTLHAPAFPQSFPPKLFRTPLDACPAPGEKARGPLRMASPPGLPPEIPHDRSWPQTRPPSLCISPRSGIALEVLLRVHDVS